MGDIGPHIRVEVPGRLSVGDRARHVGERYPGASDGTATIERMFVRGERDVEIIAKRDKPGFGPTDTHGFWANYHTVKVAGALPGHALPAAEEQE